MIDYGAKKPFNWIVCVCSKPLTVAVYEFGGYAMRDAVWAKNAAMFAEKLGKSRANLVCM